MTTPRWSLKQVKALVAAGDYSLEGSSAVASFPSEEEAYAVSAETIAKLSALDFSHRTQQIDECDVYGVVIGGAGWYLKVTIRSGSNVIVISLHPLRAPLRTKKGMVTP